MIMGHPIDIDVQGYNHVSLLISELFKIIYNITRFKCTVVNFLNLYFTLFFVSQFITFLTLDDMMTPEPSTTVGESMITFFMF